MNELFKINNISKCYGEADNVVEVIKNLSFSVMKSESIAVVGASGSGKSTLLHLLGGLDKPSSGEIYFNNRDLKTMSSSELDEYRNKNIGFIFQFHYLMSDFTAEENVMLPALIAGEKRSIALEKAKKLLMYVNLGDRLKHLPRELSGGEQQRVAVARSLINNPKVILADEPTGSLDKTNSVLVEKILFSMQNEFGVTLLLVTHDVLFAEKCNKKIVMEKI